MAPRSRSSSAPTHGAANRTTDGTTRGKRYRGQQQERVRRAGHSRSEGTNITSQPNMRVTLNQHCRVEFDIAFKLHHTYIQDTLWFIHPSLSNSCHPSVVKYNMRYCAHIPTCALSVVLSVVQALMRSVEDGAMPTTARCPRRRDARCHLARIRKVGTVGSMWSGIRDGAPHQPP